MRITTPFPTSFPCVCIERKSYRQRNRDRKQEQRSPNHTQTYISIEQQFFDFLFKALHEPVFLLLLLLQVVVVAAAARLQPLTLVTRSDQAFEFGDVGGCSPLFWLKGRGDSCRRLNAGLGGMRTCFIQLLVGRVVDRFVVDGLRALCSLNLEYLANTHFPFLFVLLNVLFVVRF